ncbi:hypothetical protein IE077_001560 [Cardiosporidium cionae]|uniref:PA domain-containing protein n=1 Tax=Cardiosporidium cionae TaxID=476202 RepID=A0ABQ7JG31_9APIC|nr:hypothetical protein IE077_001560 [Cardiosporidium cionae]|eukprot:KAF8822983.1 hypothetical protein IE077_001560 [Cardiosporidium cionae]
MQLGTLFFVALVGQLLCQNVYSQIIVVEPDTLANKYNSGRISGSTASFGTPYYGEILIGKLQLFDIPGCNATTYNLSSSSSPDSIPAIVMLRRGGCHFIDKIAIAEKKGAKAVIIMDAKDSKTTASDVHKIIMSSGSAKNVTIPSVLIGEMDAIPIIEAVNNSLPVILELDWDLPKFNAVEMDLWLSPSLTKSLNFLEEFAANALILKHKVDFYPHYWVMSLPQNYLDKCTDLNGNFCGLNAEWDSKVSGRAILEETVREVCLWETTQILPPSNASAAYFSEFWWKYMQQFRKTCTITVNGKTKFGENCSYDLMKSVGANTEAVKTCYKSNFKSILSHELITGAWSPVALIINGWRYSGPLEADQVTRAICTGYMDTPTECKSILKNENGSADPNRNYSSGAGFGSILVISFLGAIFGIALCFFLFKKYIYPRIKAGMHYTVMAEVQKEMQAQQNINLTRDRRSIGAAANTLI